MKILSLTLEGIPPSVNHAYFVKGHQKILTKVGARYKNDVKAQIVTHYARSLVSVQPADVLSVIYIFEMEEKSVLCKGWPATAKTCHKKVDTSNRIKLVEDALCEALGYDDSQNFNVLAAKTIGERPRTHIHVYTETPQDCSPVGRALAEALGS